jgi:hypothetical protein
MRHCSTALHLSVFYREFKQADTVSFTLYNIILYLASKKDHLSKRTIFPKWHFSIVWMDRPSSSFKGGMTLLPASDFLLVI